MGAFLVGKELTQAIEAILSEEDCRCAVAFWGKGSADKLPGKGQGEFKLICNLASGGTNPYEIEKLDLDNVRQCDTLHTKVYIGAREAIVASANASANGLGLEGNEALWIEAGTRHLDVTPIAMWFDDLWQSADVREISDDDLTAAKEAWRFRQSAKPSHLTFERFDASALQSDDFPYALYWYQDVDIELDNEKIASEFGGQTKDIEALLDKDYLTAESDEDADYTSKATWVLVWKLLQSGRIARRTKPYWFPVGRTIRNVARIAGDTHHIILPADRPAPVPFDLAEVGVLDAFYATMTRPEFETIIDVDYQRGQGWYTPVRIHCMRAFWPAWQAEYLKTRREA